MVITAKAKIIDGDGTGMIPRVALKSKITFGKIAIDPILGLISSAVG